MTKFILSLAGLLVCLLAAEPTRATSNEQDSELTETVKSVESDLSAIEVAEKLTGQYREWVEANLRGSRDDSEKLEDTLFGLINRDIHLSENRVRELAKRAALARGGEDNQKLPDSEVTDQEQDFQRGVALLNTKEALYRSLNKTNVFSTKYRLLGDYIDLLRRELQMPRLKLAGITNREKNDNNTEGQ